MKTILFISVILIISSVVCATDEEATAPQGLSTPKLPVFVSRNDNLSTTAAKQLEDLTMHPSVKLTALSSSEQVEYLRSEGCLDNHDVVTRFQELPAYLSREIWKFCALYKEGGLYLDIESPLVDSFKHLQSHGKSVAVLNDSAYPSSIHGSLVLLHQGHSKVAEEMIHVLMETSVAELELSPLFLPTKLYESIQKDTKVDNMFPGNVNDDWLLLEHTCQVDPMVKPNSQANAGYGGIYSYRLTQHCPDLSGFCCTISDTVNKTPVLLTKSLLYPYQLLPELSELPTPYNAEAGHYDEEDLPFIATIREKTHERPDGLITPNFFETLLQNDCLPSSDDCAKCLRDKTGSDCKKCSDVCSCFCKSFCRVPVEEKFIRKELFVKPPSYSRDPTRLVPRIIHQTWFEEVDEEKYPNMSRFIESFKQSGWEYRFYTDDDAANFLSTHFPPEVRQAYDSLIPGAFKADLFRYCVLLVHGGIYADMDIILESNLDFAVSGDIGFMVPVDEPGLPVDHRMCLWNGFIAAAPGHPFLAKVIETVVNNVRNRFTSVDVDQLFCPEPELSVLHAYDTLFTAGPCILGATINKVLGHPLQQSYKAGEMFARGSESGLDFVRSSKKKIPGRTIILSQNKEDVSKMLVLYCILLVISQLLNHILIQRFGLRFCFPCRWVLIGLRCSKRILSLLQQICQILTIG